jgi:2-polyprenyl-6-methoxyphenol hydroxylase-like FAD-dependent oxidoreductase
MATTKPITIVGGGLAGLALGIGLRQRGVPVSLWEAGHYPRHRVSGEFICGRGQETLARLDCCIGDAITMIPPITGNGMSMALESAELAIEPLIAWSRGKISWAETQSRIARCCDAAFARRLFWAKWLQRCVLTPSLQNVLIMLVGRSNWFWRTAFEHTR